ncbi:hypothetical protein BgAZ_403070 [Babesia gibsoni]|uniref:Uncharacterized protein n=1 Tax=Babesia gibsoni TaxID=33632 RepID=A0AAD8PDG4_BABGI|nr:hypothetical protein BgAZ_403070 [Babesia gibsoni]
MDKEASSSLSQRDSAPDAPDNRRDEHEDASIEPFSEQNRVPTSRGPGGRPVWLADDQRPATSRSVDANMLIAGDAEGAKLGRFLTRDFVLPSRWSMSTDSKALIDMRAQNALQNDSQLKYTIGSILARKSMLDQALQYKSIHGYRHISQLKGITLARQDRHIERALLQRDANMALRRADCTEANFADYVHYDLEEFGEDIPTAMKKDDDTREVKIEMTDMSRRDHTISQPKKGLIEELVSHGVSPSEVAKLSDLFEHPSSLRNIDMSLIPWVEEQTEKGYWRNRSSLFILCITMAISIGNVETFFKLNATWDGMVFMIPYFLAYILVVQPMISLELTTGQLFRGGQSAIYDKLRRGCSGVGTAIVILCLVSGCVACSRSSAEYLLYVVDVFKSNIPWKLSEADKKLCETIYTKDTCQLKSPLCHFADGECIANAIGKAYIAYQDKFDPVSKEGAIFDGSLLWAMGATYMIVGLFQVLGLGTFTFSASFFVLIVFFLIHMQVFATMYLEGATDYLWASLNSWKWQNLFGKGRIWSHSIRSCLYEFIIGNGTYSTLAARSRVGYDVSKEAVGVGLVSGYMTTLLFCIACALIGSYSRQLKVLPSDIMWMLEQDCDYILLPLGFQATETMERTLCVLQFGCCVILMCATLAIQIEVAVTNLKDVTLFGINKIGRRKLSIGITLLLMAASMSLATRSGKLVVWFLEIAVGDLGRVFTVLMSSIVVGWLYGVDKQKQELGKASVYAFNTIFWAFNIAATVCEGSDETVAPIIWWVLRLAGIVLGTIAGVLINMRDPNIAKPLKTSLWWLFFGNIEHLRTEICRITPMRNAGGLPMTVFWSMCIKWLIPCWLSNAIADILEEILAPNRIDVNINNIPPGWKWITLAMWSLMVLAIFLPTIMPYLAPRFVQAYHTMDLHRLPSCPIKYYVWANLLPRTMFREFFKESKL